ncbi:MAG TPA: glycosyltransferase family 4 protein [Candidatus Krumholzibacteria bacterium]|nr:glycosyltransferase family 4 protein [Candidatus Krumholzibacteria bacterium]
MRILYFHQHFTTPDGATGTRSYEMARHLVARGHEVTMVCGSSKGSHTGATGEPAGGVRRGEVDGIRVVEISVPYSNYDSLARRAAAFLQFAWRSIAVARHHEYDLLFATSTPLTAAIPGIAMRVLKPYRPFVFEVRDLWPELPRAMGMRNPLLLGGMSLLEKLAYLSMRGGVALSPGIGEGMRRRSPARTPIAMVPNGCDLELFRPDSGGDATGLPEGFPRDGLRCVFTGAHGLANGLDAVLDAAKVLRARGRKDIHLVFVGDGKLKPGLVARKEREGLDNCYFFGPLPKTQLPAVMGQTDVGLMILANIPAFYYGTSPNKFFDYIATGLPVVNNYPGWLAEMITANGCGLAVAPERPDLFADALIALADDPGRRRAMGLQARALAEREFDRRVLAERFAGFLEACGRNERSAG